MEIKLNTGDKITIPEDYEATIEGNQIIIKKQEGFKDGDILISKDSKYSKYFVIFKSYDKTTKFAFNSYFNSVDILNFYWFTEGFRLATEKEKQEFFDELKNKIEKLIMLFGKQATTIYQMKKNKLLKMLKESKLSLKKKTKLR